MSEVPREDLGRAIRVVVFCGPFLEPVADELFAELDRHPEVEFLGGFRHARGGEGVVERIRDLWRRRRLLALPHVALLLAGAAAGWLLHPRAELERVRRARWVDERIEIVPDIHAPAVLERVRELQPDLGLIYGGPIVKPKLFEIPRFGTLGIHHGCVPEYRGKKTTFWEMYNGEQTAGVTIQRVNAGVDRGEIVRQGAVPIEGRRYGRVWDDVQRLGVELYRDAILDMKRGVAKLEPQGNGGGRPYRDPKLSHIVGLWWRQLRGVGS
jgi:folate-dependent phosphoribosylglycinamide formyltransferase PurN